MRESEKKKKIEVQKEKNRKKQLINQKKTNTQQKNQKECLQFNQLNQVYH